MSKHYCSHCGGSKWGLVRYTHFARSFCRKSCKKKFYAKQMQERDRQRRWIDCLAPPKTT